MPIIPTVTDEVDASQLGLTLLHGQLPTYSESIGARYPQFYAEALEAALAQVRALQARGVHTLCIPTPLDTTRDILFLQRVALETGVTLLAATGVQSPDLLPHSLQVGDVAQLTAAFVRDIRHGIARTGIQAAFLLCAANENSSVLSADKVLAAVGAAQQQTGVPLLLHSLTGNGLDLVAPLAAAGVAPARVLLSFAAGLPELPVLRQLCDHGFFIEVTCAETSGAGTSRSRCAPVVDLLAAGLGEHLFLSGQGYFSGNWLPDDAGSPLTDLLDVIVPSLRRHGVSEVLLRTLLIDNPRRWFSGE